jgi:molybdopterin-containing oxidoreductase family iron-sulfur binding subunit
MLRRRYGAGQGAAAEAAWRAALQSGVVVGSTTAPVRAELRWSELIAGLAVAVPPEGLELHFASDRKIGDGERVHNAWLQECADPLTQLAWDNALLLSPATAHGLGLALGDRVQVSHDGQTLEAPVYPMPGHADGAATLHLGYGVRVDDDSQPIGIDAYRLRTRRALAAPQPATLRKLEGRHAFPLIQVEERDQGRPLALQADRSELKEKLRLIAEHRREHPSLYAPVDYPGYRWAMAVDLSRCVGCNACVIACRAENNVPVIGPEEVRRGREMHWLRVDRYFEGSGSQVRVRFQPLMCVHCENAPCEYVCPVNATVHSTEGLNEMVYNRCIGTRYCSNNCPYKVRRFNWHAYGDERPAREALATNPEVTVRGRGVMEKCTYCVQRIERARISAELQHRPIADGDIQTACQQACPASALVFGSLHDAAARVSALHRDARRYDLLGELGTRPRTAYLARLTREHAR